MVWCLIDTDSRIPQKINPRIVYQFNGRVKRYGASCIFFRQRDFLCEGGELKILFFLAIAKLFNEGSASAFGISKYVITCGTHALQAEC